MKQILNDFIEYIELLCIALSIVFAFLSIYFVIGKNSMGAIIKLYGIKKEKRRDKKNEKNKKENKYNH